MLTYLKGEQSALYSFRVNVDCNSVDGTVCVNDRKIKNFVWKK